MRRIGLALLAIAALSGGVQAQSYPTRPVTMVVPFPPGGNTDLMARALQAELSKALGQSIIINNKGGAAGTIGILELVKAEPDGYTIALTPNNPLTAQPHMQQLRYGMETFRYVCLTYDTPYVLIAGPQAPFKTFQEFVAFAKAKTENLVYGHPGVASQPHLVMLAVLVFVIFVGFPIAFTLLFLALVFGYFGLGARVFDLAYFQTIGLMKEEVFAAVPSADKQAAYALGATKWEMIRPRTEEQLT